MKRLFFITFGIVAVVAALAVALDPSHAMAATHTVPLALHALRTPDSLVAVGLGAAFVGSLQVVTPDRDTYPARDSVRQQLNHVTAWLSFINRNRLISSTVATLPAVAIGGTTTKVKVAQATVVLNSGVANAVGITDDAWTLTGGVLAVSSFRKYLLLVDSADTFTVTASSDAAAANDCQFSALPADGLAIVGILTVATDATHTFTPATTALNAAGITATYMDGHGDDSVFPFGNLSA